MSCNSAFKPKKKPYHSEQKKYQSGMCSNHYNHNRCKKGSVN